MSKLITLIVILFTITTFSDQMPRQLVEASTKLVDIMQEPRTFLDVVEDMSFSNRVQFIRMVDSASNAFPSSREAKTNRNKELARYYFIATNTPYLNVPVIANSIQSGQILLSQLQFKQQGTNTLMQQRTDKTNVVYKANSNTMDFDMMNQLDSDVKFMFEDLNHVQGELKNKRNSINHHEIKPYDGQGW